jgi:hypothetical protein
MKKWIFSLTLLLSLGLNSIPLEMMIDHEYDYPIRSFGPTEAQYLHPDHVRTPYLSVRPMQIEGFSGESLDKLQAAFEVLEQVVNSYEFKERVINFKNSEGERAFASNKGLSNEKIYELFMEGREVLQPHTPGEMNFFLKLYNKSRSKVIGYTSPTTNLIHINWRFFKNYQPSQVASNLAHEWTHKMGFDHRSAKEHDSAPYAIGYIVEDLAEKILATSQLQKVAPQ